MITMEQQTAAIAKAINCYGSQAKLAKACGLSQQAISRLLLGQRQVGAKAAVQLERATRGVVKREDLRPDLFRRDP